MELKPCPFCGYKWPFVEKVGSGETAKTVGIYSLYVVQCGACTASITGKTKENAVLEWNRRASRNLAYTDQSGAEYADNPTV